MKEYFPCLLLVSLAIFAMSCDNPTPAPSSELVAFKIIIPPGFIGEARLVDDDREVDFEGINVIAVDKGTKVVPVPKGFHVINEAGLSRRLGYTVHSIEDTTGKVVIDGWDAIQYTTIQVRSGGDELKRTGRETNAYLIISKIPARDPKRGR